MAKQFIKFVGANASVMAPWGTRWGRNEAHPVEKFSDEQRAWIDEQPGLKLVQERGSALETEEVAQGGKLRIRKPQVEAEDTGQVYLGGDKPPLPAQGFSDKEAAEKFARDHLDGLEVDKRKSLKFINEQIEAAYNAKFVPVETEDQEEDDGLDEVNTGEDAGGATDLEEV